MFGYTRTRESKSNRKKKVKARIFFTHRHNTMRLKKWKRNEVEKQTSVQFYSQNISLTLILLCHFLQSQSMVYIAFQSAMNLKEKAKKLITH